MTTNYRHIAKLHPKPIIIAACCAIAIVVGTYLWGSLIFDQEQKDKTPAKTTNKLTARTSETKPDPTKNIGTPEEDMDTPILKETEASPTDVAAGLEPAVSLLPDDFVLEEDSTEEVPVSPFGFGPYPKVPNGYPEHLKPVWTWTEERRERYNPTRLVDFELMGRVLIKLWNQGDRDFNGVVRDDMNGKVYPLYPGAAYVTWTELKDENGKVIKDENGKVILYPSSVRASEHIPRLSVRDFMEGTAPTNIRFIDQETGGIDPYSFLGLN